MADAKPFWSALYDLLTQTDTEDYEYRRPSIYEMSTQCIGSRIRGNLLKVNDLVARERVEPPDASLFRAMINGPNYPSINNLTRQDGRFIVTIL